MLCNSTCPYKEGKYESGFPWSCDGKRKEKKQKIITNSAWWHNSGEETFNNSHTLLLSFCLVKGYMGMGLKM